MQSIQKELPGFLNYRQNQICLLYCFQGIILAQNQYDKIVGNSKQAWRGIILDIFRSHTCLFIGLSGNDDNLTSILMETKNSHASKRQGDVFWGVRFSDNKNDPKQTTWNTRGVFQDAIASYQELPGWLLKVCQIAATKNDG
ncbi:MAG: SIR2 family protein [Planctomycetota bacterium]|jgi:hypothetical protein